VWTRSSAGRAPCFQEQPPKLHPTWNTEVGGSNPPATTHHSWLPSHGTAADRIDDPTRKASVSSPIRRSYPSLHIELRGDCPHVQQITTHTGGPPARVYGSLSACGSRRAPIMKGNLSLRRRGCLLLPASAGPQRKYPWRLFTKNTAPC
jgi:hypothetical protein